MPTARFDLHVHEGSASGDSGTPAAVLAQMYADRGFDLVGFVGHDRRPDVAEETAHIPIEVVTGIEHEVQTDPRRIHVVDFPTFDFSYLAHPSLSHPTETLEQALMTAESYDVDAIEVFNRGSRELPPTVLSGWPQVANSDAHNTFQLGASHMTADLHRLTPQSVFDAIRRREVELHNPGLPARDYYTGRLHQGLNLVSSGELL